MTKLTAAPNGCCPPWVDHHPHALHTLTGLLGRQPRLLDLFCGAGGCSAGYARAGFAVTGVDLAPQGHYPYFDLIQDDALLVLDDRAFISQFDVIHASPPCPRYSSLTHVSGNRDNHPDLVAPVRDLLIASGKPYIIENVVGAPLLDPIVLCGSMFELGVKGATLRRHRLFESNMPLAAPPDACAGKSIVGVYGTGGAWTRTAPGGGGVKVSGKAAAEALGIDWTDYQPVLAQAIPPAYTEHIGRQLIDAMEAAA